jgi:hypothetical protein
MWGSSDSGRRGNIGLMQTRQRSGRSRRLVGATIRALIVCALCTAACDEGTPTGPTLGEQFTLSPGESVTIRGSSLSFQFLRVSGDSRCPADAVCIQGGDAIVHVRASGAVTADYELHTGSESRSVITPLGLRLELTDLQPYPFSSGPIRSGDYRATFVVSR